MLKKRDAYFCNLKLLLIFLVVLGHIIEKDIKNSTFLYQLYQLIYIVHMPLFSFLSGLYMKNIIQCKKQFIKILKLYLILQIIIIFPKMVQERSIASFLTPYWHLWYLLSLVFWNLFALLYFQFIHKLNNKKVKIILQFTLFSISILLGCLIGGIHWIDRTLSLSRTIVFFPYVLLGIFINHNSMDSIIQSSWYIKLSTMIFTCFLPYFIMHYLPSEFLYQTESYYNLNITFLEGIALRVFCYIAAICSGLLILWIIPKRRYKISKTGADTMPIYLFHIIFVKLVSILPIHYAEHYSFVTNLLSARIILSYNIGQLFTYLLISVWIIYLCYLGGKWNNQLCTLT